MLMRNPVVPITVYCKLGEKYKIFKVYYSLKMSPLQRGLGSRSKISCDHEALYRSLYSNWLILDLFARQYKQPIIVSDV